MSFLFYTVWLIIRKYDFGPNGSRLANLFKPLMVYFTLVATTIFPYHGGLRNPTLILGNWIWVVATYNRFDNYAGTTDTRATVEHVSRYAWIYILAPLLAAPFAGLLARKHLDEVTKKNGMDNARPESFFESRNEKVKAH